MIFCGKGAVVLTRGEEVVDGDRIVFKENDTGRLIEFDIRHPTAGNICFSVDQALATEIKAGIHQLQIGA